MEKSTVVLATSSLLYMASSLVVAPYFKVHLAPRFEGPRERLLFTLRLTQGCGRFSLAGAVSRGDIGLP